MQKIFCFLITLVPLAAIAQDKIDFYSSAAISKYNSGTTNIPHKTILQPYNNDGHTLELVFTVPANQQHVFRNMTGVLITQAARLDFILPGETKVENRNRLRFTSQAGKVYVFFNEELRHIINDEQHAYAICTPGYACSLIDVANNSNMIMQAECITVGYKPYGHSSSKLAVINEAEKKPQTISIFPNPVLNTLHITNGSNEAMSIILLSAEGKQLDAKTISGNGALDLSAFPAGLYFLRITTGQKYYVTRSFIKQ